MSHNDNFNKEKYFQNIIMYYGIINEIIITIIVEPILLGSRRHSECYFSCCCRSQGVSELRSSIVTLMTSFPDLPLRSYFSLEVKPSEHSASECWTTSSFQNTACFHTRRVTVHVCLLLFFLSFFL